MKLKLWEIKLMKKTIENGLQKVSYTIIPHENYWKGIEWKFYATFYWRTKR